MGVLENIREVFGVDPNAPDEERQMMEAALTGERETTVMLKERMLELEMALEDEGWQKLGFEGQREFSRDGLEKIINMSRIMTLKNPLIQRAVEVRAFYIWGQGVQVQARDKKVNQLVQDFMDDTHNRRELFGHAARIIKDKKLATDGNIFFVLNTNGLNGKVALRSMPVDEVKEIIVNPDDRVDIWYYKREWSQMEFNTTTGETRAVHKVAYYPDVSYNPSRGRGRNARPRSIGRENHPIMWEQPVYHVKVGGLDDMRFGVPETYAALDWARAYKSYLEDWASLVRAISMFAWRYKTKKNQVRASRDKLAALTDEGQAGERPVAGSFFVDSGEGDLVPINKSGAHTSAADGKMLRLMVASCMHLPDTILSNDPQQGALATAKTLDRPTELAMRDRQLLWADVIKDICNYVVARNRDSIVPTISTSDSDDSTVDVIFPPIVQPEMKEQISSIISGMTLDGKTPSNVAPVNVFRKLILTTLNVDDVDEILATMEEEDELTVEQVEQVEESLTELITKLAEARDATLRS